MNYATALALIQAEIIANGNNEITANVLRPVLEAMIDFPNDVIGALADLDTSDTTSIVNAINSIVSQNLPNKTVLFPIDTTGIDFNQDELLWVRDAINQTATNNGAFTCNLGEQMVFFCDVLIDIVGTEANMQRRYYRLTSGATLVNSLGSTLTPPLMPDGSSINTIELTGDLVIDLGDIGTDDVEDAFNSDASQPFTINGDKFVQAIQNSENKLWQWIGGDGTFGNSATLATSTDFVDLTGTTSPPLATVLNDNQDVEIDTPTDGQILVFDDTDSKWKNETLPAGGTVTSVAVSGSDGIEVDSGSPITTSGTIVLGLNKTTTLAFLNVEDGAEVNDVDSVNGQTGVVVLDEQDILGTRVSENVATTKNIDLDTVSDFHYTMTADTAFTFTNTPTGTQVRRCKLRLTGEFAPSWTQAGLQVFGDGYDGTKWNDVLVEMWLDGTIKGLLIFQQRETA